MSAESKKHEAENERCRLLREEQEANMQRNVLACVIADRAVAGGVAHPETMADYVQACRVADELRTKVDAALAAEKAVA